MTESKDVKEVSLPLPALERSSSSNDDSVNEMTPSKTTSNQSSGADLVGCLKKKDLIVNANNSIQLPLVIENLTGGMIEGDDSELGHGDNSSSDSLTDVEIGINEENTAEFMLDSSALDVQNNFPSLSMHHAIVGTEIEPKAERRKTIRFSMENQIHEFTRSPDEFKDNPWNIPETIPLTLKVRNFVAVYSLPFTYGASIQLTNLFFLIELAEKYRVNNQIAGLYLVSGYGCKVLFASLSRWAPKTVILISCLFALMGYASLFISQRLQLDNNLTLVMFVLGSTIVSSNETIGGMQTFVRDQHQNTLKDAGWQLSQQFFVTMLGGICSYAAGGVVYFYRGLQGIAIQGAAFVGLQFLLLTIYIILDNYRDFHEDRPHFYLSKYCMNFSFKASGGRRRLFTSELSEIHRSLMKYYPNDLPHAVLRFVLPHTNLVIALSSACIWGISAIFMKEAFKVNEIVIGVVFAGGVFSNLIVSYLLFSDKLNKYLKRVLPCPRLFIVSMIGMSISTLILAVPYTFPLFAFGFILYNCFCGVLYILLTEMQGSSTNTWESSTTQVARRILTGACLFSLPNLYGLHTRLPLLLAFWVTFVSSVLVLLRIYRRPDSKNKEVVSRTFRKSKSLTISGVAGRGGKQNLVYSERVMLSWLIKGRDL